MSLYFEALAAAIQDFPGVREWRLSWADGVGTSLGIKDNHIGSVYSPLSTSDGRSGSYLIQWEDGRLSRGSVDGSTLVNLAEVLAAARAASYVDPDAVVFLEPAGVPHLPLYDPATARLLRDDMDTLIGLLRMVLSPQLARPIATVSGSVGASAGQSGVMTSRGLDVRVETTSTAWSAGYDRQVSDGDTSRSPFDPETVAAQLGQLVRLWEALQRTAASGANDEPRPVLLTPGVATSLAGHYVWRNLGGSAVVHGQSAFPLSAFEQQVARFRHDIELRVEPLRPMTPGAFVFSNEGLPAAPETYVEAGRLLTPVLNLKYARMLGWRPTTPPGGSRTVVFGDRQPIPYEDACRAAEVLILDLLGLHTQDSTTGQFSLSAPHSLLLDVRGQATGRVRLGLQGNYFDLLNDPATRFVRFPFKESFGLLAHLRISE
ncbi:MAG TPA: metallopeptidase TldD-related protein [Ardenticatenaceae bacterium]|nr:metallopeptidase TldD-related protein [Ardenticatenaceae bacterium]